MEPYKVGTKKMVNRVEKNFEIDSSLFFLLLAL